MRGHMFDRLATVGVACLYILSSQVPSTLALSIDINDPGQMVAQLCPSTLC